MFIFTLTHKYKLNKSELIKIGVKIPKILTYSVLKLVKKWSKWIPKMIIFTSVPKCKLNKSKFIKMGVKIRKILTS